MRSKTGKPRESENEDTKKPDAPERLPVFWEGDHVLFLLGNKTSKCLAPTPAASAILQAYLTTVSLLPCLLRNSSPTFALARKFLPSGLVGLVFRMACLEPAITGHLDLIRLPRRSTSNFVTPTRTSVHEFNPPWVAPSHDTCVGGSLASGN